MENPTKNTAEIVCTKCKVAKAPSEFGKHPTNKNGLQSYCKDCARESNREYTKIRVAKYKQLRENGENLKTEKQCTCCTAVKPITEFYKHSYQKDGYRSECKSCCNKKHKAYINNYASKQRVKNKNLTSEEAKATLEVYKEAEKIKEINPTIKYHIDHLVSVGLGGTHTADNLQILTAEEHLKKTLAEKRLIQKVQEAYEEYELCFKSKYTLDTVATATANQ